MIPKTKNPFVDPDYGKPPPPESVYYAEVFAAARADYQRASAIRSQTKLSGCRWIPVCFDGYSHEQYARDRENWELGIVDVAATLETMFEKFQEWPK